MRWLIAGLLVFGMVGTTAREAQARRLIGTQISGQTSLDVASGRTVDTATASFADRDGRAQFTVDFIAQHDTKSSRPPTVVDVVITQLLDGDSEPSLALQVDGQSFAVTPRLRSRRSIVASIPFDEFLKLANANAIVEHAFGVDLEFGAGQLRMLQFVAQRWNGR